MARAGPGVPLIARQQRARAWWVVAGLALIVAAGGILVHGDEAPLGIEMDIQRGLDRHAGSEDEHAWARAFSPVIRVEIIAIVLSLVLWSIVRRWWRVAAACAAVPLSIVIAEKGIKPVVDRVELSTGDFMYPSGHVTGLAAAATLVLVIAGPRLPRSWALVLGVACVLACAIAVLAGVASGEHGPIDTVAALPTGVGIALAWVLVVDIVADASAGRTRAWADARA